MKLKRSYIAILILLVGISSVYVLFNGRSKASLNTGDYDIELKPITQIVNGVNITVDPRIELLSVVQLLSNYDKNYNLMTKEHFKYKNDVNAYFGEFKKHEAVKVFEDLTRMGYSYDAPPATMLYLTEELKLREDIEVTEYLLGRIGGSKNLEKFVKALEKFYIETNFAEFFEENIPYYEEIIETTASRMGEIDFIKELEDYYGINQKSYNVIIVSLYFKGGYGPRVQQSDGSFEIYSITGPKGKLYSMTGSYEIPDFGDYNSFKYLQRHEFSHSFVNPTTDKYLIEANQYAHLHEPIKERMRQQAYGTWVTTLNEHIVRAVTTRLAYLDSEAEGEKALAYEKGRGFIYIDGLLEKLVEYEENRDLYPNFEVFYPVLLEGLERYNN